MLTTEKLKRATELQSEIDALVAEQSSILNGDGDIKVKREYPRVAKVKGEHKPMSAEAKAKIAAAQKARWNKFRADKKKPAEAAKSARKKAVKKIPAVVPPPANHGGEEMALTGE